nr:hypothetical protein CFP56_14581 [Quercus suber]
MEVGAAKKNKRVQKADALATVAIEEGKLQLPMPCHKRKFDVDTSPKPFGTITRPRKTPLHPFMTPSHLASVERHRVPSRGKGPFTPPKPPLLMNDATYVVEQVMSIIKEEDIDDCDEYATVAIGEFGLHDLAKSMVRMKTLELRCKVKELDRRCSSQADLFIIAGEEKIHLSKELEKLRGELSNAESNAIAKYSSSQKYLNDLGIQYVQGFEDFRAQVSTTFKALYFFKIEICAEKGSTTTMMSDGADQEVDGAAREDKGDDQAGQ